MDDSADFTFDHVESLQSPLPRFHRLHSFPSFIQVSTEEVKKWLTFWPAGLLMSRSLPTD